jgi:hypothetical protein
VQFYRTVEKCFTLGSPGTGQYPRVCVYYCRTYYKAVCGGGRGAVNDKYYDSVRRDEACVD